MENVSDKEKVKGTIMLFSTSDYGVGQHQQMGATNARKMIGGQYKHRLVAQANAIRHKWDLKTFTDRRLLIVKGIL